MLRQGMDSGTAIIRSTANQKPREDLSANQRPAVSLITSVEHTGVMARTGAAPCYSNSQKINWKNDFNAFSLRGKVKHVQ